MELPKAYEPNNVEKKWYKYWEENKVFSPNKDDNTFTIMIPPPNVTGILHLGHVLNNSIQDILIRKQKMSGKNILWLPGTDHASIATEAKVTKLLKEKGINKKDIPREEFLKHAWAWTEEYGGIIIKQLKRLGCACDWDRGRFTMDDEYYKSVISTFVKLYKEGLIYRGKRMINWDPKGLTALSDEEVIHKEKNGKLWHIKYPISNSDQYLIVATTRPETMLGDTGVAINPKDKRYNKFNNQMVDLPLVNKQIPIFSDDYVDMEFGTGCVKVTPAHDPNDFEMYERNNLEILNIMNEDGTLNENAPVEFQGLDRFDARDKVIEKLQSLDLIDKIENYTHKVGYSERTDVVVEPRLSLQWFLKMDHFAKDALKVVKEDQIKFYPDRWRKIYNHWLKNIKDWCISRQLLWGHRIPVWYKGDEIYCSEEPPRDDGWTQDKDVLDTWFSSWIWPLATLGWPENTEDLKRFYPTQDLVTGPDIIFFWVARMIMSGLHFENKIPFSNVYFTSIIRDSQGRKMSKSLGNSPDPLDLFDKYGVDAVRVSILMLSPQGSDVLFSEDNIDLGRNFMNKLWNCSRFLMMNIEEKEKLIPFEAIDNSSLELVDLWILSRLNSTIKDVNLCLDKYKLNEAIKTMYNFIWKDYCDWYIEFSKSRIYGINDKDRSIVLSLAVYVLHNILKLLHPYAPFITEEIWSYYKLDKNEILINSSWPTSDSNFIDSKVENDFSFIMQGITSIRNIRSELNVSPKKEADLICRGLSDKTAIISDNSKYFKSMARINNIICSETLEKPAQSSTAVINDVEFFIPLSNLIDLSAEIDRLENKISDIQGRMNSVKRKLDNSSFIDNAPSEIVNHEKKKYENYKNDYNKLLKNLNNLKNN